MKGREVLIFSLLVVSGNCFCSIKPVKSSRFCDAKTLFMSETTSINVVNKKDLLKKQASILGEIWKQIAFPTESQVIMDFRLDDFGLNRNTVRGMLQHFQFCKDCAGDNAFLMATQDKDKNDLLRLNHVAFRVLSEEQDEFDDESFEIVIPEGHNEDLPMLPIFPIEPNDDVLLADTMAWVKAVIADFGVCPFTMDPNRAGIPVGGVRYQLSRAKTADEAFFVFWNEVLHLLNTTERECSTILLVFPEIELFGNYELFENYCDR
eukprot:gene6512-13151_t